MSCTKTGLRFLVQTKSEKKRKEKETTLGGCQKAKNTA
jgi:hypothetical protein